MTYGTVRYGDSEPAGRRGTRRVAVPEFPLLHDGTDAGYYRQRNAGGGGGLADLRIDAPRAGPGTGGAGAIPAGDSAVSGGGADGGPFPAPAHPAVLLRGIRVRVGGAFDVDPARAHVGVAGVRGAGAERRGAQLQRTGGAGVPAAGGAGRGVSERGGSGVGCVSGGDGGGTDGRRAGLRADGKPGAGVCRVGGGVPERHGVDGAGPGAGGAAAARDRPAGHGAGWAALSLAHEDDAGRGFAGHVRGAAGRGGGADAGVREGHFG